MAFWTTEWKYPDRRMPQAAYRKYKDWSAEIRHRGKHPKEAAESCGDTHYERLKGYVQPTYSIRLSQEHRVVFEVNDQRNVVTILQVGGHY